MEALLHSLEEKIYPPHTALLVVDMQNDFCHPSGSLARMGLDISEMSAVAPKIKILVDKAKEKDILIIYLRVIDTEKPAISAAYYEANLSFYEPLLNESKRNDQNTPWAGADFGEAFYQPIEPLKEDIIVTKHRFGAFVNTKLDQILRSNGIKTVIIAGVMTEVCVESTARSALDYDYYVVVPEDCTATTTNIRKQASLDAIGTYFGVVTTSSKIMDIWQTSNPPAKINS